MSCTRYKELLSRYVDGEVTARQRRELLAHVETCHDCAAWLARVRQADVLLKGIPETQPSDRVRDSVLGSAIRAARMNRSHPQTLRHASSFSGGGGWHLDAAGNLLRFDINPQRIAVAVAAALLAIVGLAYWLNVLPPLTIVVDDDTWTLRCGDRTLARARQPRGPAGGVARGGRRPRPADRRQIGLHRQDRQGGVLPPS